MHESILFRSSTYKNNFSGFDLVLLQPGVPISVIRQQMIHVSFRILPTFLAGWWPARAYSVRYEQMRKKKRVYEKNRGRLNWVSVTCNIYIRHKSIRMLVFLIAFSLAEAMAQVPAGWPEDTYRAAAASGERVYEIISTESKAVVYVYRDGMLARMGHDHVVASRDIHGYVLLSDDPGTSRTDLYLSLATLTVDDPELRKAAEFESEPSASDIEGTRTNMLKSLQASEYPYLMLRAVPADDWSVNARFVGLQLAVDLTLHGVTRRLIVPVEMLLDGDMLSVSGDFNLQQTKYGIEPFSVFGGALAVKDQLTVSFDLHAKMAGFGDQ